MATDGAQVRPSCAASWLVVAGAVNVRRIAARAAPISGPSASPRGQAFGLAMTGTMTLQGLSMAGAGALAEVLAPGTVMALAGAASITATLTLWPKLRAR
jgi:hypothetical protein